MKRLRTSFSYKVIFGSVCATLFYPFLVYIWIKNILKSGNTFFELDIFEYITLVCILYILVNYISGLLLTPISITIKDDSIKINRLLSSTVIYKKNIVFIRSKESRVKDSIVIGSNVFGLIGYSTEPNWGKYISYITDTDKMVAIETTHKKYVVSCKNPQTLIDSINS